MFSLPNPDQEAERAMLVPARPDRPWLQAAIILSPGVIGLAVALVLMLTE